MTLIECVRITSDLMTFDHVISQVNLLLVESIIMAVAVERLPTFTPLVGDSMDNVRTNSSLFSTTLSHSKVIRAVARLLPGVKKAVTCLEA